MIRLSKQCLITVLGLSLAMPALAVNVTISGQFRSTDPTTHLVSYLDFCPEQIQPYQIVGPLSANTSGAYRFRDSGNTSFSQDTVLSIYQGMPNLNNLATNLLATVDDVETVNLVAGQEYYVLVQPWCELFANGVWGQLILGPGTVSGPQVAPTPAHWQGTWSMSDGLTNLAPDPECPQTYYDVSENITLDQSGTWYISTTSGYDGRTPWLSFYDGAFDPDNPEDNLLFYVPVGGPFEAEAGTYTIVTTGVCEVVQGDWYYVMWPPAPFEINAASSAAYYDTTTGGQGELFDFDMVNGNAFGALFTYDTAPADGVSPQSIGSSEQRWFTLQGVFEPGDTSVEMKIYSASGGVFNARPVPVTNTQVGTAVIDLDSCTTGELSFSFDTGEEGTSAMNRLFPTNVAACEASYKGPGVLYE